MQNFYADREQFTDSTVTLTGEEHFHATRSCRVRPGEMIGVTDGCGKRVIARIADIDSTSLTAEIESDVSGIGEPKSDVTVALSIITPSRFEVAVEKCTELGAVRFIPLITERGDKRPGQIKGDRLKRICLSAIKQSGRSRLPEITDPMPFDELVKASIKSIAGGKSAVILAGSATASESLADIVGDYSERAFNDVTIVIGPEGDFSEGEMAMLSDVGAKFFSLGGLILRAETAAIIATALVTDGRIGTP